MTDISRRELLRGAVALSATGGIESILSETEAQARQQYVMQEYDIVTKKVKITTDVAKRLTAPDEFLQQFTGFNFGTAKDSVIGLVTKDITDTFYRNNTPILHGRTDIRKTIKNLIGAEPAKIRSVNIGHYDVAFVYDAVGRIYRVDLVRNVNQGEHTQFFKQLFGFVPFDMLSFKLMPSRTKKDDVLYVKRQDGLWNGYKWQNLRQPFQRAYSLEALFRDTRFAYVRSLGAANLTGKNADTLYAIRTPLQGVIDPQLADDIILNNQNAIGGSAYRRLGSITRWELPIPVYVNPSVSKQNMIETMKYWHSKTGISFMLIDANTKPGVFIRAGTDGLSPNVPNVEEYGHVDYVGPNLIAAGRALIDGVYPNNRARSGLVVYAPDIAYCTLLDFFCRSVLRHEKGHVIGVQAHPRWGGLMEYGDELIEREIRMFKKIQEAPHGTGFKPNGSWRVILPTPSYDPIANLQDIVNAYVAADIKPGFSMRDLLMAR